MLQAASCADSHVFARLMGLKWCPGGSGSKSASIPARLLSLRLDKNFAVGSLSFSPIGLFGGGMRHGFARITEWPKAAAALAC